MISDVALWFGLNPFVPMLPIVFTEIVARVNGINLPAHKRYRSGEFVIISFSIFLLTFLTVLEEVDPLSTWSLWICIAAVLICTVFFSTMKNLDMQIELPRHEKKRRNQTIEDEMDLLLRRHFTISLLIAILSIVFSYWVVILNG